ncbi:MAG: hypothetical protein U5K81_11405 [Trueperaceae bacterium]|nr:hypothetical protein [Trueperaceae bacterium]
MHRSLRFGVRRTTIRLTLAIAALAFLSAVASAAGGNASPRIETARLADEGRTLVTTGPDADTVRWTVADWRTWAAPRFDEILDEAPELAGRTLKAADFDRFGAVAVHPGGARVAFSVTSYAVLTTVSLVGTLDPASGAVTMVHDAKFGDLEDPTWSPSGRYLAYALGTARASGEMLAIDDTETGRTVAHLDGENLLQAWRRARGDVAQPGGRPYLPHVRALVWRQDGTALRFVTDRPGEAGDVDAPTGPGVAWRFSIDGGGLELLVP